MRAIVMDKNPEGVHVIKPFIPLFLCLSWFASGCFLPATSEQSFKSGANLDPCDQVIPICKGYSAGCVLTDDRYLEGNFPGRIQFLVETIPGDWIIRVSFFFAERRSPGTDTTVDWFEPGCTDQYRYQESKDRLSGDLFEKAGRDQVFEVEQGIAEYGDHLIEINSDATARYVIRTEVVPVE